MCACCFLLAIEQLFWHKHWHKNWSLTKAFMGAKQNVSNFNVQLPVFVWSTDKNEGKVRGTGRLCTMKQ